MRLRRPSVAGTAAVLTLAMLMTGSAVGAAELHVSLRGDDSWSGELATPNEARTDGPCATLGRAVEASRNARAAQPAGTAARIIVHQGVHTLAAPIVLKPADSGLIIEGAPGEDVTISGGRTVTAWQPYRGAILQADLSALALPDLKFRELYRNGQRQPMARAPDYDPDHPRFGGWLYNAGVVEAGSKTKFRYRQGELDLGRWTHLERAWVVFHPAVNYERCWWPLKAVDPENRVIEAARGVYPLRAHDRYHVCGILEELDAPGEWYVDPEARALYYQPPGDGPGEVTIPALESAFVIKGEPAQGRYVEGVRIARLTLRDLRSNAVHMTGARSCAVVACDFRNVGVAVRLDDETHACRVASCDITQTLGDGVTIWGTPGKHDRVSHHIIDNNYMHDIGWGHLHNRTGGVFLIGCSHCQVTHNHIHDGPRYAIGMDVGNDNEIAHNHCHHVNIDTCDTGIIEAATAWDWRFPQEEEAERNRKFNRGNAIHHNLLHDSGGVDETGPGELDYPAFSWGIYLDTHCSGWRIHHNVVYNTVKGGFMLNCGQDNVVENNVFVDGKTNQVQFNPWSKYVISGNRCERNVIAYQGRAATLYTLNRFEDSFCRFRSNLVHSADGRIRIAGVPKLPRRKAWSAWQERGQDEGSVVADPLFVDPDQHDYRLRPDSPAFALGFEAIDLSQVGNYESPERPTWPRPEAPVFREPADYASSATTMHRHPPLRDYETYGVGETERNAHVGTEAGLSSVAVTDETAASGNHSLKFTDAAGQKNSFTPYVTYMIDQDTGRLHGGFDLRVEEGAIFVYEWRDDPYNYHLGPNLRVDADGRLSANGKQLLQISHGRWVRFDFTCGLGDQATGTYDLTVGIEGEAPREFPGLKCSPEFDYLSCAVIMSMATGPSVFYVDNVTLRPAD